MENRYIHEISSLHCSNGELHISYGDDNWEKGNYVQKTLVFNTDTLFRDLPTIVRLVCKENKKEQEQIMNELNKAISQL